MKPIIQQKNYRQLIHLERQKDGYRTTDPIDLFKEFGTGYVGSQEPSVSPFLKDIGWQYDASGHGDKGWVYPKNGQFYHTYGQVGKNVFTDVTLEIEDKIESVVKEEIMKIIGGNQEYTKHRR